MSKFDLVSSFKYKQSSKKKLSSAETIGRNTLLNTQLHFQEHVRESYLDVFCGDVKDYVNLLRDNSIHLVVTSPPYNCNIRYDNYYDNKEITEYQEWLTEIFAKINPKIVSGGRVAVNFPLLIKYEGKRILLTSVFENVLKRAGFEVIDYVVWIKAKNEKEAISVAGRSTAWGSWLSPVSPHIRPITEFILIAKKEGKYKKQNSTNVTADEFKTFTTSAWFIPPVSDKKHPAPFPVELPKRLIKLFTYKHENVLDPFMGVGNTAIAAVETGRNFYGCDISSNYIKESIKRLKRMMIKNASFQF